MKKVGFQKKERRNEGKKRKENESNKKGKKRHRYTNQVVIFNINLMLNSHKKEYL